MLSRTMVRTMAGAGALALCLAGVAPVVAHEGGGDIATNTRGVQVETEGEGKRMSLVANLQYNNSGEAQNGSDIEFVKVDGREYALAGTLRGGMQIVDITKPTEPRRVAVYDCAVTQGDIQVWRNNGRVLASYTADSKLGEVGAASKCARDLKVGADQAGTFIVDISTPRKPQSVSFIPVERGSHNMTIHPSGDYLYNSNSDLATSTAPSIDIFDVSNPVRPKKVNDFAIPFVPTSLGSESHDVTFNKTGNRAYSAALSQTLVLDTSNPAKPRILSEIVDPSINVVHQAEPVRLKRPDGTMRSLLIISDERAGAAGSAECPGGGLHVYDVTKKNDPQKLGAWFIDETTPQAGTTCTSHVLRIYPRQKMMTIAWYSQGVRVIDIKGLATFEGGPDEVAFGDGIGMKEVGHYTLPDSDTWSFKTNKIKRDGSFFGYGNDLVRGFDVYKFKGLDRNVPPLKPRDMAPRAESTSSRMLLPLAVLLPAIVLAGLVRRRSRKA